jgi:hypothetical protein
MRFRCGTCGASQWRGIFREPTRHLRWAIFHGIALGVCGAATKVLFTRFGLTPDGWRNGPVSLAVCALLMLGLYAAALFAERCIVVRQRCRICGERGLRPEFDRKGERAQAIEDIVVGGPYATRDRDGTYRIVKVLAVDEFAVHLRSYANRFKGLPAQVTSSRLSLGGLGSPEGLGIGHFPLAREAFDREERVLVGRESVADDELDGYRIWAGIDRIEE